MTSPDDLTLLEGGGRSVVHRRGNVVIRDAGPWTPAVHALLRHLEDAGFAGAPRLVGSGLDPDGREVLTFIEGEFTQPGPWSLEGAAALGGLLRSLHKATRSFRQPPGAVWFPLARPGPGRPGKGHRPLRRRRPVEHRRPRRTAGRAHRLGDRPGQSTQSSNWPSWPGSTPSCTDDTVAGIEHLPPLADRARQLAAIADAYGLTARQRRGLLDQIIEFAIVDTAWEADDSHVTPDTTSHPTALWAMARRARSAAWMIRNRRALETALNRGAP